MAKVITFGLQKGGVSKSTTTGIVAYLLSGGMQKINKNDTSESREFYNKSYKVLALDMDSQGNLTELLTRQPANNFLNNSIFEAIAYKEPEKFIHSINDNLDILPANNFLASFAKWIYTGNMPHTEHGEVFVDYEGIGINQLNIMLENIKDNYDFIIIDTPPALSEQTTNALIASNYVVVLYEASKFCYSAIPNFMETIEHVRHFNGIKILGVLRTLNDIRRKDTHFFNELIERDYPDLIFDTLITRKASTGRLPLNGFKNNNELNDALSQFKEFYKEFIMRLKEDGNNDE